jgi:hypothetical protein
VALAALLIVTGCAKTEITHQEKKVLGPFPHPDQIWVYDFAATSEDLPVHSSLDKEYFEKSPPQTKEHIAEGKKLGKEIQTELVAELHKFGISAKHATAETKPQLNDIVIQGYIISFDEGDATKRVAIGMGQGASHLKAVVEGLQMTEAGLRVIGSGSMDSGGNKTPGGAVGLVALAATKNPAGLIVSTGMHAYGEHTGDSKVEGRAKQMAEEIAEQIQERFKEQGWL